MNPLITVVTPSYNHERFIEATIQSVLTQDYAPIEYIVMDGGSTDGTLDILRKYEDRLTWVSERDKGQGDAINKGFRRATGDIWCWLNSDDLFTPGALKTVAEFFQSHPDASFVYGDAEAITLDGTPAGIRTHIRPTDFDFLLNGGDPIVQPAAFWRAPRSGRKNHQAGARHKARAAGLLTGATPGIGQGEGRWRLGGIVQMTSR